MEKKYQLELVGITYNQIESGVYAVILQQKGGTRRIPIIIGYPEAQAIECKLQEINVPRPLTHDTMVNVLSSFGISLTEVEIRKLSNGVFAADLYLSCGGIRRVIDSRSSDAIALAIRVGAPIYTTESVLREAGFNPPAGPDKKSTMDDPGRVDGISEASATDDYDLSEIPLDILEKQMLEAAEKDDYETAARIKEEIDRRHDDGETDSEVAD